MNRRGKMKPSYLLRRAVNECKQKTFTISVWAEAINYFVRAGGKSPQAYTSKRAVLATYKRAEALARKEGR